MEPTAPPIEYLNTESVSNICYQEILSIKNKLINDIKNREKILYKKYKDENKELLKI